MTTRFILAATGAPFGDPDAAHMKRQTLVAELGVNDDAFAVVPHPDGGYAIVRGDAVDGDESVPVSGPVSDPLPLGPGEPDPARTGPARRPVPAAEGAPHTAPEPRAATAAGLIEPEDGRPYPQTFVLNVSPRAYADRYALVAAGVLLVLTPWGWVLPSVAPGTLGGQIAWMLRLGGLVLALWNMGRFMYSYLFLSYAVSIADAQARRGPFSRETPPVSFAHVRGTKVVQAFWERMLDVGTVQVHTDNPARPALAFSHIAGPARFERDLRGRCRPAPADARRRAH